jgi:hypothetical protein
MAIDLYTWNTPNGCKISVALEKMGLPYDVHPVNIGKGEQFNPDFLTISQNNLIPAISDPEGPGGTPISVFWSGEDLLKTLHVFPPRVVWHLRRGLWGLSVAFSGSGENDSGGVAVTLTDVSVPSDGCRLVVPPLALALVQIVGRIGDSRGRQSALPCPVLPGRWRSRGTRRDVHWEDGPSTCPALK